MAGAVPRSRARHNFVEIVMRVLLAPLLALALAMPALAQADAKRGEMLYTSRCGACHSIQNNRTGPKHLGVVGRKAGSVPGFEYSPALKKAKFVWTEKQIDKWLQGPSKLVKGTAMAFTVPVAADRAAIIAYLKVAK
jgi:cytochrome c